MYRDLQNIAFIDLFYTDVVKYVKENPDNSYLVLGCTQEYFNNLNKHIYKSFDHGFYVEAKVPYEDRWNKFYYQRDIEKEKDVFYNILGLKDNEEFVFIHEDPFRNRLLDEKLIPSGIKQIRTNDFKWVSMFDFLYTIQRSKEIHIMDSCFLAFIDNMLIKHSKLFVHNYGNNRVCYPTAVKLNWNIYGK